jgi:membrane-bound serine protease (ClpP class)
MTLGPARAVAFRLPPLLLALLAMGVVLLLAPLPAPAAAQEAAGVVPIARAEGAVSPPMARYLAAAIANAERQGAPALVIELDTPGGLMSSSDEIVRAILDSRVPVVVWVAPREARAASAGVFLTYAGHVAAMAPGTRIGSASPVALGGELDDTMARKVTNDAVSQVRNLADLRGRNADWAEAAVRDAANVTAEEAARLGVVDVVAADLPSLLAAIDGRTVETAAGPVTIETGGATTAEAPMGWLDRLLMLLADPTIAYLLLALGGVGIFLELSVPGVTLPGVVGGISVILGLFGLGALPVNWAGVALIGLAFVLLVVDFFVPSFGTLTIGGLASFVIGSHLLFDGAGGGIGVSPILIWTIAALLGGLLLLLAGSVLKTRFLRPATGREGLVGMVGAARTPLGPDGVVFVAGELWQATVAGASPVPPTDRSAPASGPAPVIPAGAPIAVSGLDGLRLVVRPATTAEAADAGVAVLSPSLPATPASPAVAPAAARAAAAEAPRAGPV